MSNNMKTYQKTATVEAKIFEKGDEDGFLFELPFVRTLENNRHGGRFGEHYLCIGIDQEKWLVEKSIFERTYKEVTMSNNKQNMKLYTEEQVRQMLEVCRDSDLYEHILTFEDILKTQTPIELPSHYEIWEEAIKEELNQRRYDFMRGADWMRDKIQGGNQ